MERLTKGPHVIDIFEFIACAGVSEYSVLIYNLVRGSNVHVLRFVLVNCELILDLSFKNSFFLSELFLLFHFCPFFIRFYLKGLDKSKYIIT